MRRVLSDQPDVVAGDLNSYADAAQASEKLASYQPFLDAQSTGEGREFLGYATAGAEEFLRGGMARVPTAGDTTRYGGAVDHVFVRRTPRVAPVGPGTVVGDFILSDHKALVASLELDVAGDVVLA